MKDATPAQISLAWMLHKYPNVVPIPRFMEHSLLVTNINTYNIDLSKEEFSALEACLNQCRVCGHRGLGGL